MRSAALTPELARSAALTRSITRSLRLLPSSWERGFLQCNERVDLIQIQPTMHSQVHNGQRPYQCDQCEWSFRRLAHLQLHQKRHARLDGRVPEPGTPTPTGKLRFPCPQCDAVYVRYHDLTKHLNELHSETRFECYYCLSSFWSESTWLDHERNHVSGGLTNDTRIG